jgi:hypothetical protein
MQIFQQRLDRGKIVLETLLFKVKLLSLEQIAKTWCYHCKSPRRSARKLMRRLQDLKLVNSYIVLSHPLLELLSPIHLWQPGDKVPDFEAISNQLRARWTLAPKRTTVFISTQRSANLLGGVPGVLPPIGQETHDINFAQVYLNYLRKDSKKVTRWFGEMFYKKEKKGEKLPDAMILDDNWSPILVIEFGGAYPAGRVEEFFNDCNSKQLPYELW